jgi:hypothetical protein
MQLSPGTEKDIHGKTGQVCGLLIYYPCWFVSFDKCDWFVRCWHLGKSVKIELCSIFKTILGFKLKFQNKKYFKIKVFVKYF